MIATTIINGKVLSTKELPLTFHNEQQTLLDIQSLVEEVMHDPKVAEIAEENQRKYGTLSPEELRHQFTI